jgi:hypothetical protein
MIALVVQCAVTVSAFLLLLSAPFGTLGRELRQAALCIFVGAIAFYIAASTLIAIFQRLIHDWRFFVAWLAVSPIAYAVLQLVSFRKSDSRPITDRYPKPKRQVENDQKAFSEPPDEEKP